MPRPDFPKNILEFQRQFSTEEACEEYLFDSRWPNGFVCPACGDTEFYFISTRGLYQCKANKHQTSLTAETIMHGSRFPLTLWFWAAYLVTTVTNGISALQLQRQLGLSRYATAYNILQKLRASMVRQNRDKIGPVVEVDETYIGGPTRGGRRGRGTEKEIVIVAVERRGNHAGRIRLRNIKNVKESSLMSFIQDSVEEGSTVITDSFSGYHNLSSYGYFHESIVQTESDSALPLAHLIFSNLKAWLEGTFHGVSPKHLQAYLNEFVFRFNRRRTPMAAFQTLLGLASNVEQWPTEEGLYSGEWRHPNPGRRRKSC